jgi:thiamine pyrophosphokinase
MTRTLLAGAAALGMMTGAAMAQSTTTQTTTTNLSTSTTAPALSAPVIVSGSSTNGHSITADGDQHFVAGTMTRDSAGNTTDTTVTNTSYPLTDMVTSTRKTTNVSNGIATETTVTTNSFPSGRAPATTSTSTRTYAVGSN